MKWAGRDEGNVVRGPWDGRNTQPPQPYRRDDEQRSGAILWPVLIFAGWLLVAAGLWAAEVLQGVAPW